MSARRRGRSSGGEGSQERNQQGGRPRGGQGGDGGQSSGRTGGGRRRRSQRNRRKRSGQQGGGRQPQQDAVSFWGDAAKLPPARTDVRITDEPAVVPRSLGKPPLPGHETIAEHYFGVVYDRAVATAGALAAAGGLIDPETLAEELGD